MQSVPSNGVLVHPTGGSPHWSSKLGGLTIVDFRVKISDTPDPDASIRGDWYFTWDTPVPLTQTMDYTAACQRDSILAESVTDLLYGQSHTHRCMRNNDGGVSGAVQDWYENCWANDCPNGPGAIFSDGSFGFSVTDEMSGQDENSTAFFGCDDGSCCMAWGPDGNNQYTTNNCGVMNGGTKSTTGYAWIYIRELAAP